MSPVSTMAASVVINNGQLDAYAEVDLASAGLLIDDPTAVQILPGSAYTSTAASIDGFYNDFEFYPLGATASSSVTATYDAAGLSSLEFNHLATSETIHDGPGYYPGGRSQTSSVLQISVLAETRALFVWGTDGTTETYGYVHDSNGIEIANFCGSSGFCTNSTTIDLFLSAGEYTIYSGVGSPDINGGYGAGVFQDQSYLSANFSPVPLPASLWLFVSGLSIPLINMFRNRRSNKLVTA